MTDSMRKFPPCCVFFSLFLRLIDHFGGKDNEHMENLVSEMARRF